MSRDLHGDDPPRPRRQGRPSESSTNPRASGSDAEYSTFRPNPAGASGGDRPRGPQKKKPLNPLAENFEKPAGGPTWWERILLGRVSTGQLAQFCRQFAAYLNAGVDLTKSLSSLERQFSGTALGPILGRDSAQHPPRLDPRRGDGAGAAGVRPDVPQHDQGGRGTGRRARDTQDAGQALRSPPAPAAHGPVGHDLPGHRHHRRVARGRADHDLPAAASSRRP